MKPKYDPRISELCAKSTSALPAGCRLRESIRQVERRSHDLARAMQRLRRTLELCRACPQKDNCALRKDIDAQIDKALDLVMVEWGWIEQDQLE